MKILLTSFLLCLVFVTQAQTYNSAVPRRILISDTTVVRKVNLLTDFNVLPDSTLQQMMRDTNNRSNMETPRSFAVKPSYDVGEITVNTSVDQSGSAVCDVPIELPAGRGDCKPEISLRYTQFAGDGVLGWGWGLQAFSSINSTNFNLYYNNKTAPAVTDSTAAFELDGMRLIWKSPGWYRTESGNIKVKYVAQGDKIVSFTVFRPDGSQSLYKPIENNGIEYPLSRMTDVAGNHIDYTYEYKNGHHYLLSVSYGGRGQTDNPGHFVHVGFSYDDERQDVTSSYTAGVKMSNPRLLYEITVKLDTVQVKSYTISYKPTTPSLVSEINCWSGSYKRFKPLRFDYGYGSPGGLHQYTSSLSSYYESMDNLVVRSGKFSYGSDDDGLIVYTNPGLYRNPLYEYYYVPLVPDHELLVYPGIGANSAYSLTLRADSGLISVFSANIDNIPGDEIVQINNGVMVGKDVVRISAYIPGYMDTALLKKEEVYYFLNDAIKKKNTFSFCPKTYLNGDFNGDGKDEIFAVSMNKPLEIENYRSACYLIDLDEVNAPVFKENVFDYNMEKDGVMAVDFNGDGKADICHIHDGGFDIYTFNSVNGSWQLNKIYSGNQISNSFLTDRNLLLSDVNSDGKTDLLVSPAFVRTQTENVPVYSPRECPDCHKHDFGYEGINSMTGQPDIWCYTCEKYIRPNNYCIECGYGLSSDFTCPDHGAYVNYTWRTEDRQWQVLFSTGIGFDSKPLQAFAVEKSDILLMQDMDNDGVLDLVCQKANNIVEIYPVRYDSIVSEPGYSVSCQLPDKAILVPATVMQAPNHLFLYGLYENKVHKINYDVDQTKFRLLSRIYNSADNEVRFSYQKLNDSYNYTIGNNAVFPYIDFTGPVWVVTNMDTYSRNQLSGSSQFTYQGAVSHVQGLGFRGFKKVNITDGIRAWYDKKTFDPLRYGILLKEETDKSISDFEYNFSIGEDKIVKSLLSKKTENDLLNNNTCISTYSYDSKENLIGEKINYGNALEVWTDYTRTNTDTENLYYLGQIQSKTQKYHAQGQPVISDIEKYEYNSAQNMTFKSVSKNSTFVVSTEYLTYDDNQNPVTYEKINYSSSGLVTQREFDSYGRLVKETDPLGFVTRWQYDTYGNRVVETNHKGQKTNFYYDDWGRNIKTVRPDNTQTTVAYAWASAPSGALTETTTETTGKPTEKVFLDALGREVRKGTQRFDGQYLYVDKVYNNRGLLEKESLPFRSQAPSYWNAMTYDFYDRLTRISYASGRADVYGYSPNKVSETKQSITVTKEYDAAGRMIKSSDTSGDIVYSLRADGQPVSITAPGNITTSFTYDDYGRRLTMTDPSAGVVTFGYDSSGNQNYKKEANGNETRTTYDVYGRKTAISMSKGGEEARSVTFEYDTNNRLYKVTESTGASQRYQYDQYDRVTENEKYLDEYYFMTRSYTYNAQNQVSSVYYNSYLPSTVGRVFYTYANGHRSEIKIDGLAPVWKIISENDMGLPASINTGPLSRTFEYDGYGFPVQRVVKCGERVIQDMSTSFDSPTGNLTWRQDNTRNIRENFTYDALNRLTGFNGKTITYDVKGNITGHSGVGTFEYSQERPYAVEYVTPYGDYIPAVTQDIIYNEISLPQRITEGVHEMNFRYDYKGERTFAGFQTVDSSGKRSYRRLFSWDNCYEEPENDYAYGAALYVDGDVYSATCAWVITGPITSVNEWENLYFCRDYMGSITHIVDKDGNLLQELSYDPWGRLRNPENQELYAPGKEPLPLLGRGYTGHLHMPEFGLIHMNARLYDPVVGRFLSPDPYVQMPDFSQNFNRYSYCLNNPLVYKDESGEFFLAYLTHFFKGLFTGKNPFETGFRGVKNEFKIIGGLFSGGARRTLSRFTKELPQTFLGFWSSYWTNAIGLTHEVSSWGGATVSQLEPAFMKNGGAFTLGCFIQGGSRIEADPNNSLFQHEYGHYLQSQEMGWKYLGKVAIPSLKSASGSGAHSFFKTEQDANMRAFIYMNENVEGFYRTKDQYYIGEGWDFRTNPLAPDKEHIRGRYYDVKDPSVRSYLIESLSLTGGFWYIK